ncbi:MAG: hypothetical protein K2M63_08755 [Muribaculaceae bacterium]|nr:hypothetical protein [Muribaculaceae bacterium]
MKRRNTKSLVILIMALSFLSANLFGEEKQPVVEENSWLLKRESPGKKPKKPSNEVIPFFYDGENIIIGFDGNDSIMVEVLTSEEITLTSGILYPDTGYCLQVGNLNGTYILKCQTSDGSHFVGYLSIQ